MHSSSCVQFPNSAFYFDRYHTVPCDASLAELIGLTHYATLVSVCLGDQRLKREVPGVSVSGRDLDGCM